jgi:hypothetical protein
MNDDRENDARLHGILQAWKVQESLPPRFEERVLHRLTLKPSIGPMAVWSAALQWLSGALARPSLAASYLALLLAAGVAAGYWHGRMDSAHVTDQLGSRYVRLMNAYETAPH